MAEKKKEEGIVSPPLKDYLREKIPLEEVRDYSSAARIESIDFVKGFAIVFIIIAHSAGAWLDDEWIYIYGIAYAVLDILGPSLFVFLSALSVVFSIKRKEGKLPDNVIRNRIFSRGFTIMLLGILYNIIAVETTVEGYPFPLNLWGWNILMFIGFSQIVSYYALKMGKTSRAVLGVIIIAYSQQIREIIYLGMDENFGLGILHYIITSPAPQVTLFPWVAICFLSTIFGEYLYDAMEQGTEKSYYLLFKQFIFWGLFFVGFGILLGFELQSHTYVSFPGMFVSEYPQFDLFRIMNQQNYVSFPGLPLFLIRGTAASMFYNLGAALLIIAISFYYIDIKLNWNYFVSIIKYYGKVSLSLFLIHYIFLPFYINSFNIVFFPFVVLSYIAFMGFFMYAWMETGNGVGSPEWIMIQIGRIGQKTGESVKKEAKIISEKTREGIKKASNSIKKEAKIIAEKTKKLKEKKQKEKENVK